MYRLCINYQKPNTVKPMWNPYFWLKHWSPRHVNSFSSRGPLSPKLGTCNPGPVGANRGINEKVTFYGSWQSCFEKSWGCWPVSKPKLYIWTNKNWWFLNPGNWPKLPNKKVWKEMSLWFQGTKQITLEDQLNIQISTLTSILVYYRSFSSQTGLRHQVFGADSVNFSVGSWSWSLKRWQVQ